MTTFRYYDNLGSQPDDGNVAIDRVYCLLFSDFSESNWAALSKAYESLPGWIGTGAHGCPCWYSASETAPYLVASVEPSGLQVFGTLPADGWEQWHVAFLKHTSFLPSFEV